MNTAIDHDILQPRIPAHIHVGHDDGIFHVCIGIDVHPGEQQERRNAAPDMMHPPETSEVTAWPRRPSSS